jgi:hypothetical protein
VPRRFTLLDHVYFDALFRVTEVLAAEGLPFALVGGGAVQAWIASLRTGDVAQLAAARDAGRSIDPGAVRRLVSHDAAAALLLDELTEDLGEGKR